MSQGRGEIETISRELEVLLVSPRQSVGRRGAGEDSQRAKHQRQPRVEHVCHRHTDISLAARERGWGREVERVTDTLLLMHCHNSHNNSKLFL